MTTYRHPEIPFLEGDTVQVLDTVENQENESYAHLIGKVGIVLNPLAGLNSGRDDALIEVSFDGDIELMFPWRFRIINRLVAWEV